MFGLTPLPTILFTLEMSQILNSGAEKILKLFKLVNQNLRTMSEERKESAVINFENQNGWDSQRTAEGELELNRN